MGLNIQQRTYEIQSKKFALRGLVVACLPLNPRITGSNPAEDYAIFKGDKNLLHEFFKVEVRPSVPLRTFTAC